MSIQSGREKVGSKPSFLQSSSEMFLRIVCAFEAVISNFFSCSSLALSYSAASVRPSRLIFGWSAVHDQQLDFDLPISITARSRSDGFFFLIASWYLA